MVLKARQHRHKGHTRIFRNKFMVKKYFVCEDDIVIFQNVFCFFFYNYPAPASVVVKLM